LKPKEWRARERREQDVRSAPQLLLHNLAHLLIQTAAPLSIEQLFAARRWQEIETHGQHLAELDPGAAQFLERGAGALGARLWSTAAERQCRQHEPAQQNAEHLPAPTGATQPASHARLIGELGRPWISIAACTGFNPAVTTLPTS
jgi:hypothetical protein